MTTAFPDSLTSKRSNVDVPEDPRESAERERAMIEERERADRDRVGEREAKEKPEEMKRKDEMDKEEGQNEMKKEDSEDTPQRAPEDKRRYRFRQIKSIYEVDGRVQLKMEWADGTTSPTDAKNVNLIHSIIRRRLRECVCAMLVKNPEKEFGEATKFFLRKAKVYPEKIIKDLEVKKRKKEEKRKEKEEEEKRKEEEEEKKRKKEEEEKKRKDEEEENKRKEEEEEKKRKEEEEEKKRKEEEEEEAKKKREEAGEAMKKVKVEVKEEPIDE